MITLHALHLNSQRKVAWKRRSTQESNLSRRGMAKTGVSLWPETHKHTQSSEKGLTCLRSNLNCSYTPFLNAFKQTNVNSLNILKPNTKSEPLLSVSACFSFPLPWVFRKRKMLLPSNRARCVMFHNSCFKSSNSAFYIGTMTYDDWFQLLKKIEVEKSIWLKMLQHLKMWIIIAV